MRRAQGMWMHVPYPRLLASKQPFVSLVCVRARSGAGNRVCSANGKAPWGRGGAVDLVSSRAGLSCRPPRVLCVRVLHASLRACMHACVRACVRGTRTVLTGECARRRARWPSTCRGCPFWLRTGMPTGLCLWNWYGTAQAQEACAPSKHAQETCEHVAHMPAAAWTLPCMPCEG